MLLQLLSILVLLTGPLLANAIIARPFPRPPFVKRQLSDSSLPEITSTSANHVSETTSSDPNPNCVASYYATEDTKCEEVASEYGIQLSHSEATSLAGSETCEDALSGYRICVVITAPYPKLTTSSAAPSVYSNAPILSSSTILSTVTPTGTATVPASSSGFGSTSNSNASGTVSSSSRMLSTSSRSSYPSSPITSTTSGSTCSATATPPAATQPGTVLGCTKWYIAEPGDFCYTVAQKFGIPTDTFMAWNPSVEPPTCPRLLAGDAYCVATCGGPSTTLTYSSVSASSSSTYAFYSTSTSSYPLNPTTSSTYSYSSATPSSTLSPLDHYTTYLGNGSAAAGWPTQEQWVNFTYMFDANTPNMKISCAQWTVPDDSYEELSQLQETLLSVSAKTGIDARFILAIVIQESEGCVRVITTDYSHLNPGLMQSFNGTGTCNTNSAASVLSGEDGIVTTPCPYSDIYQQLLDGTNGTQWGPGLVQDWKQQGHTDVSGYYRTARFYNGGSLEADGNLIGPCCTASYASDIANRLTGWVYAPRTFDPGAQ